MVVIHTSEGKANQVKEFPDDLNLYDFIFEYFPPSRADLRTTGIKLLIDEETGKGFNFEELKERTDSLSVGFRKEFGVSKSSIVSIFTPNSIDFVPTILATHRLGGIVSASNPQLTAKELAFQLETAKSRALIIGQEVLETGLEAAKIAGIPLERCAVVQTLSQIEASNGQSKTQDGLWTIHGLLSEGRNVIKSDPGESSKGRVKLSKGEGKKQLSFLLFSSGTTGLPKSVAIQHSAPIANVLQVQCFNNVQGTIWKEGDGGRIRPGKDVSLGVLPQFHIYGLVITVLWMLYAGVANVVIPKFKGIEAMLQTIIKYKISTWWLVPPMVVLLCKDPKVEKYLKEANKVANFIMIGAAPLNDDLSRLLSSRLPGTDWGQGWGMTEVCTVGIMHPPGLAPVLGSTGRLVSNAEARIVKENPDGTFRDCDFNEPGELWIRQPSLTLGYSNNEKATRESWREDGFFRTGDEVMINRDLDVFVVDRLKELVKVKGNQVAPAELEGYLLDHPSVSDSGVIGIPDEAAGELPVAFVTLSEESKQAAQANGKSEEDKIKESIRQFVREGKINYKWLARVVIIDVIPKTASGKILRRTLRDQAKALGDLTEEERAGLKKKRESKL